MQVSPLLQSLSRGLRVDVPSLGLNFRRVPELQNAILAPVPFKCQDLLSFPFPRTQFTDVFRRVHVLPV